MSECKYCKSENIEHKEEQEIISYKGNNLYVSFEFSICADCGREFVSKQQILNNDARVRDAKKSTDGLLTSSGVYDARMKLGLTQEQASIIFGGGKNAFSKYERAEVSQSVAMDKLIKVCLRYPEVFREMLSSAGVEVKTSQIEYENNVMPYEKKYSAANQEKYITVKSMEIMRGGAYG